MSNSQSFSKRLFSVLVVLSISTVLFGCSNNQPGVVETQETIPATATPIPTPAPDRAILVTPADVSSTQFAEAQVLIAELTSGSGLEFEVRPEIFTNEITSDIKIVVFLEQPDNLGSLAANAPGTQFVAISSNNWTPPANGTIILKNEGHVAFLSGYLSALLAPNFRVGGLLVSENTQFNQAFKNGVSYYCGHCAAVIYPLNTYPIISQQPANSPPENWQAAFNEINTNKINVLFLPDDTASAELGNFLTGVDVAVIGSQTPPEELRSRWVATISSDGLSPLREIWDDLIGGQGGKVVNAGLKISDVNYISLADGLVWLSQGKMDLLNKVITLLRKDQIYPFSVIQ